MNGFLTRRSGRVAAGAAVALAATAGIAYASIPDGNGTIFACSLNNVGTIRLIDPAKSGLQGHCSNIETQVSWNQKGQPGAAGPKGDKGDPGAPGAKGDKGDPGAPGAAGAKGDKGDPGAPGAPGAAGAKGDKGDPGTPGAQGEPGAKGDKGDPGAPGEPGAKGDTGATGPAGASGYQQLSAATSIPAGIEITGTLACPAGKRVVGGGWTTSDNASGVNVVGSGPTSNGTAWTGAMYNTGTTATTLTLSAICINAPASSLQARSARTAAKKPVFRVVNSGR